jgi:hypothetical protein
MRKFSLVGAALVALVGSAMAQPNFDTPSSVLIYPIVDSRLGQGMGTVISVTNTNRNRVINTNTNLPTGTVQVRYWYVKGTDPWTFTDIPELLTPNDILTVLAGNHNPEVELGFLIVIAEDPTNDALINFNYLIGDEIVIDVAGARTTNINAMGFKALYEGPEQPNGADLADRDGDGRAEFNGDEYERFPDLLYLSSFFEQSATMEGDLTFVALLGRDYRVGVNFLIYDNEEDQFSRNFFFVCWTRVALLGISSVFDSLGGSANEEQVGWCRIDGGDAVNILTGRVIFDAPILGAKTQRVLPYAGLEFGGLLHHSGENREESTPSGWVNQFPPSELP